MTDDEYQASLARVRERASHSRNVLPIGPIVIVWLVVILIAIPAMH